MHKEIESGGWTAERNAAEVVSSGLEDVYIEWTRLTHVDGDRGELTYSGYAVEDILGKGALAEEVMYLFLHGELPSAGELRRFRGYIEEGYEIPDQVVATIGLAPRSASVVALQMQGMSALSAFSPGGQRYDDPDSAARLIGQMVAITSVSLRHVMGKKSRLPLPSDSVSRSFLGAVFDVEPEEKKVDALNAALILYMDHEVPASTTAGLVAVSTLADLYSGVVAALAALKGPMHGGAVEEVIKQFRDIGDPSRVDEWFAENVLNKKKKLMGFGHRVYKTYDPRAKAFKALASSLDLSGGSAALFDVAKALEEVGIYALGQKGIYPNADYYSGLVYMGIGFPPSNDAYTGLFAMSRVTGWIAHFLEYVEEQHRLIRPRAVYVGPDRREFPPLFERRRVVAELPQLRSRMPSSQAGILEVKGGGWGRLRI